MSFFLFNHNHGIVVSSSLFHEQPRINHLMNESYLTVKAHIWICSFLYLWRIISVCMMWFSLCIFVLKFGRVITRCSAKFCIVYRKDARSYLYFLLIITLLCVSVFLQSTNLECLMLVWLLVLHEKINACAVRVATRGLYVKRFWSGTEIN